MVQGKDIHVVSSEGRWMITQEGNNDFIHFADTVGAAISKAREARGDGSSIIVHRKQH